MLMVANIPSHTHVYTDVHRHTALQKERSNGFIRELTWHDSEKRNTQMLQLMSSVNMSVI